MIITGAEAMIKCLEFEGIKTIFGYPGATIAPFFDKLKDSDIRHILVRTEQNGGHSASGYARITGKPAVCTTTSGPGATNLITALATAYMDSVPLIAITGQVNTDQLGKDVFQEADITGSAEPFTKYSYLVKNVEDIPKVFKEAFYIANTGRKGPVLIDMPMDVQLQTLDFKYPETVEIRGYKPTIKGHPVQIKKVSKAIKNAKKPLLCVGGGIMLSNAEEALRSFSKKYNIPVISTMMGLSAMQTADPMYFGMIGIMGKVSANYAMQNCDLLIIIGARIADRTIKSPNSIENEKTVIHIDIDPAEIGKNLGPTIPLVGDVSSILSQLTAENTVGDFDSWIKELTDFKNEKDIPRETKSDYVNPTEFIKKLSAELRDNSIYVADVGQNQLWAANSYIVKDGKFMTTGGMGTMGYSIPAAIGAKLASPNSQVIASCGDGSFQMNLMEIATMVQHDVKVKIIVFKNEVLGLVREIQKNAYDNRLFQISLDGSPDIKYIAKAYGVNYLHIKNMDSAYDIISKFLEDDESCILQCDVYTYETTC